MLRAPLQRYHFATISLDKLVPEDRLDLKIDATIDLEFIRDAVAYLYCPNNGRPAIEPVRLIKMMLLGYLLRALLRTPSGNGIPGQCCVLLCWLLRMGLTEKLAILAPLSQNRICRYKDNNVLRLYSVAGIGAGDGQRPHPVYRQHPPESERVPGTSCRCQRILCRAERHRRGPTGKSMKKKPQPGVTKP